jgi:hypothetical protein
MQSPYPRGQSFASVPVLFSLPNVQPVIAAASTGVAAAQETPAANDSVSESTLVGTSVEGTSGTYAASPIVVSPTLDSSSKTESRWSSWSSQFTNVIIGVLLVAVAALGYRNLQQGTTKASTDQETVASQSPPPLMNSQIDETSVPSLSIASEVDRTSANPRLQPDPVAPAPPTQRIQEPPAARMAARSAAPPTAPNSTNPGTTEPVSVESQRPLESVPETDPPSTKPGIPLLLPPAPQSSTGEGNRALAAQDESRSGHSGPYGSSSGSTPFSLASASLNAAPATNSPATNSPAADPPAPIPSGSNENVGSKGNTGFQMLETDTPVLNTRDIIQMRNGQRRTTNSSGALDPSIPKIESMPRMTDPRSTGGAIGNGTVMSGQAYPPIAPQYEPISVNSNGGNPNRYQPIGGTAVPQRITQPPAATAAPAATAPPNGVPAQPYKPLSPVLPNPSETLGFDDANP